MLSGILWFIMVLKSDIGCDTMDRRIKLIPSGEWIIVEDGRNLLEVLRQHNVAPDAPCGGKGICGKCKVLVNGKEQLACQTSVDGDMTVELPPKATANILSGGVDAQLTADKDITGNLIAIDLGTTTMVCYLLDHAGKEMAVASALNPQGVYGADVISRIQAALDGKQEEMCACVRKGLSKLVAEVCQKANVTPDAIQRIALVANPCMQQLLMDISPENLAKVPFAPVLTNLKKVSAEMVLSICPNAEFLVVPDISGYVGADTMGCVLSTEMYQKETIALMVDIGTNGEMVMGNQDRMIACSTAAGPALEGANIRFGMRGSVGAIDHVTWENGKPKTHVIGNTEATGICGSGLIDAVAVMLKNGIINQRGRIQSAETQFEGDRAFFLTEDICLTQNDIRQVQLAKGAIAAGIELMAKQLGISLADVGEVLLAGAFGSFIAPESACTIGLLPPILLPKIRAVGNAAGSGAKLLAVSREQQALADQLVKEIEFLELAALPEFQRTFGKQTNFSKEDL